MRYIFVTGLFFTLSACSGGGGGSLSSLNPFTWLSSAGTQSAGASRSLAPRRGYGFAVDTRPLVDQITGLSVERTSTGAIIRATALTPAQGYHSADLVVMPAEKSYELILQYRARPSGQTARVGAQHLREVVSGFALSRAQLRGIRRIHVIAARNSMSVRP